MGFNFFPIKHMFIDIWGEYSYAKMTFNPTTPNVFGGSVQVGGLAFGAGLGYAF